MSLAESFDYDTDKLRHFLKGVRIANSKLSEKREIKKKLESRLEKIKKIIEQKKKNTDASKEVKEIKKIINELVEKERELSQSYFEETRVIKELNQRIKQLSEQMERIKQEKDYEITDLRKRLSHYVEKSVLERKGLTQEHGFAGLEKIEIENLKKRIKELEQLHQTLAKNKKTPKSKLKETDKRIKMLKEKMGSLESKNSSGKNK